MKTSKTLIVLSYLIALLALLAAGAGGVSTRVKAPAMR